MKMTLFSLLGILMFTSGCATKAAVDIVAQSQTCHSPHRAFTIEAVDNITAWQKLFSKTFAYGRLPAPALPDVDLSVNRLLIIDMGERPSSGYALKLAEKEAVIKDGVVVIPVETTTPKEGMVYAQMLTHPCLALTLPKGDYHTIHLVDQNGLVLSTLDLDKQ